METKRVIEILDEIGTLLELTGENPFRSRAYHNGAQVIGGLTENLDELVQKGSLT
jgi:DNA polymerase (family X)